jgi:type IV pilus assembly protein PilY1
VLWDIVPSASSNADIKKHLGNVLQPGYLGSIHWDKDFPKPATLPNGAWVYIVGNGYESVEEDAVLLIFNALDGSLIKAISTGDDTGNGLSAITPVFDGGRNVIAVYAGDRKGKVWKFDLSSSNIADWKVGNHADGDPSTPALFTAKDSGSKVQRSRLRRASRCIRTAASGSQSAPASSSRWAIRSTRACRACTSSATTAWPK